MRLIFLLCIFLVLASGCKKCLTCQNRCSICYDKHFRIHVSSDDLTIRYYQEYIDSLETPGLGWTCNDTTPDKHYEKCSSTKLSDDQSAWEEQGYDCTIQ
jgi:hypothetical protein